MAVGASLNAGVDNAMSAEKVKSEIEEIGALDEEFGALGVEKAVFEEAQTELQLV